MLQVNNRHHRCVVETNHEYRAGCKFLASNFKRNSRLLGQVLSLFPSHVSTIGKNLLSSNMSSTCPHNTSFIRPHNMVNFGTLTAEIGSTIWGPLQISTGFASWQRYCTASSNGRQLNFTALNRGRHLCSAGRPSCWALALILVLFYFPRLISAVTCRVYVCHTATHGVALVRI